MKTYDPNLPGIAAQGDLNIMVLPKGYTIDKSDEIKAAKGRITLVEGEATGHSHSILGQAFNPPMFRDDAMAHGLMTGFKPAQIKQGTAHLYRDTALTTKLVRDGHLLREDPIIGFLTVEDAPIIVHHADEQGNETGEHESWRLPINEYVIWRQQEGDEEDRRMVND